MLTDSLFILINTIAVPRVDINFNVRLDHIIDVVSRHHSAVT